MREAGPNGERRAPLIRATLRCNQKGNAVIQAIQRRLAARANEDRQGGFTLIELMVVVMIIAILIGIAIPAFLGARGRAQDTAAKSNLRNALSSATAVFSDNQEYFATGDADTADTMVYALVNEEPSLTFVPDPTPPGGGAAVTGSDDPKIISVAVTSTNGTTNDTVWLAALSKSGNCFFIRHVNTPALATSGSYQSKVSNAATCDAATPPAGGWNIL